MISHKRFAPSACRFHVRAAHGEHIASSSGAIFPHLGSKNSRKLRNYKTDPQSSQFIPSFVSFAHLYIEGKWLGEEPKGGPWQRPCLSKNVPERLWVHIVFDLHSNTASGSLHLCPPSVFQSFPQEQRQFNGSPLVVSKPRIQFYRPVSFCFKTAASRGDSLHPDSSVPCIFRSTYPDAVFTFLVPILPHRLPHRADAEVMFFIVVEVFGLERVRFGSRPLLRMEIVVLYVGFHAVFGRMKR